MKLQESIVKIYDLALHDRHILGLEVFRMQVVTILKTYMIDGSRKYGILYLVEERSQT
ncbi:MAG: hypothetical protein MJZ16_03855 [Bacteroidales bacterium]|nr:hypothetical protein [Bacteroidales bacterium]